MHHLIENNIDKLHSLCERYHIKKLFVFGSVAGKEFNSESDIDFLYEMNYDGFDFNNPDTYPFDPFNEYFELKYNLEILFKRNIDLIPNQDFRNIYFKQSVEKTKTLLYSNERHSKISA